ncbi:MAG: PfkB family carbohydrate kinase [Patescibacteria group bacterium]|nr:PfkB family carbohydrate kinase [Patescibacteria group bacterium]
MRFDFTTIGGTTEDITVYTKEGLVIDNKEDILQQRLIAFEFGAKLKVDRAYTTYGGGAANAAVCLSKLKLNTVALVAIGEDDRGERVVKNFYKHKINTKYIQKIKSEVTGFSFLLVGQENEHVVFSDRAANKKLSINAKEIKALNDSEWVYMTSLSGRWREVLSRVFKSKAKIAWNPGHIQLHAGFKTIGKYLARTSMLIVNKDEALELAVTNPIYRNKDRRFLNDIKNLLKVLKDIVPGIVIITNGKHGADAYDGQKFYHQPIFKERSRVDTTGVGDAFGSTFTAGLKLFKGDIQRAMKLSAANTASVIGQQGAQNGLLKKSSIMQKIKLVK